MVYYPTHLKYAEVNLDLHDSRPPHRIKTAVKSDEWRLSIILSWVVLFHIMLITFVTFLLLSSSPVPDSSRHSTQISIWATFLGVASALLAGMQYAPQLIHTYKLRLVGALSIPMMLIQSPGAVFMVLSIALRPGTNWTTWLPYAVAGAMQGSLLVMCLLWRARQHRLGIDDFGNPLDPSPALGVDSPALVIEGPEQGVPVNTVIEAARENDALADIAAEEANEATPLLAVKGGNSNSGEGWFSWIKKWM
ncbi:uncharacterized protein FIBRA_07600 [Fibroporia radiculosa]|uniref:Uncharacterized protein n=1 Tax=Fibroporia radiculosa TaxID=599839 RepID=J4H4Q2_9APHY|nr:uncharacterized protein FIBRA_07600 [Fibroporia radiculosa]CCM05384.1 predicted protein [Fibroporia radiculosa]